jgi:hypothetical protein
MRQAASQEEQSNATWWSMIFFHTGRSAWFTFPLIDCVTAQQQTREPFIPIGSHTARKGPPPSRISEMQGLLHGLLSM